MLLGLALSFVAFAQKPPTRYSISGRVNVIIGLDTIPEHGALVTIQRTGQIISTGKNGAFSFHHLTPGTYHVKVIGASYNTIDTILTLRNEAIKNLRLVAIASCNVNQDVARQDIEQAKPRLLLASGIAPQVYSNQEDFSKKYQVTYYDFGCDIPNRQCLIRYNQLIFKYLDNKYSRRWRSEVRKDVIGL
jgi:hypothetical protein